LDKYKSAEETKFSDLRDGTEIAATYHRHVLSPGDDLTNEDPRVVAIAEATWTPEVISAYQESLEAFRNL
jgi:hypothetical protein